MREIYETSKKITDMADAIECALRSYNPGTSRAPVSVTKLKEKSISLGDLVADLTDMLRGKK